SDWNSITQVQIFGPYVMGADDIKTSVKEFQASGDITDDEESRVLLTHLTAVRHYEEKEANDKVINHLKGFKDLFDHLKENKTITEMAYSILNNDTNDLIDSWQ